MKQYATSPYPGWLVLLLAWFTLGVTTIQAQDQLYLSANPSFDTEDREFDEIDTIYMKVQSSAVDFSSVRFSEFRLISRDGDIGYNGVFENHFDGTYTAEMAISELDLEDHLWTWEGLIEDDAGNTFETSVLLKLGDIDGAEVFGVRAVVEEKGADYFVLKGNRFEVTEATEFVFAPYHHHDEDNPEPFEDDGEPAPASFDEVQVDYSVSARVKHTSDGTLVAEHVEIRGPVYVPGHVTLTGKVESVDTSTNTFVLLGRTIAIDEETFLQNSQEEVGDGTVPDWLAGRIVRVYGEFASNGDVEAHFVELKQGVRPELEVRGRVDAVADDRIEVQGFGFRVQASTSIEYPDEFDDDKGPRKAALNDIDEGLIVRVFSVVTAQGVNVAERIVIETAADNGIRISGTVSGLTETGFFIRDWGVELSEYTILFNENFEEIGFDELVDGQRILVFGELYGTREVKAHHIEYRREERDEFVLFGPITTLEGDKLSVWDIDFTITDQSRIEYGPNGSDSNEGFDGLGVGQLVEVTSTPDTDGTLTIDFVHVPDGIGAEVRVRGVAESVGPENLVVLGQTITIKPETQFRDEFYQPIGPDEIVDGTAIEVRGAFYQDGRIKAYEIKLSDAAREEFEIHGVIQEVSGDFLHIGGVDFTLAPESEVFGEHEEGDEQVSSGDLMRGLFVSVNATYEEATGLTVNWIFIPRQPGDQVRISGAIEGADGFGFTLLGQDIEYGDDTQFYNAEYMPISAEELVDGLTVEVFGEYVDFNRIEAHAVEVKGADQEELHLSGRLEAYDGSTVLLGGVPFNIETFTQVISDRPNPSDGNIEPPNKVGKYAGNTLNRFAPSKASASTMSFEELDEGTPVDIFAIVDDNGAYAATVIHIRDEKGRIRIGGNIEALEGNGFLLEGRFVSLTPETFIQNEEFEEIPFESLVHGQGAEVSGELLPDGTIAAYEVHLLTDVRPFIEFWGPIESIQTDLLIVGGSTFVLTEFTAIFGEDAASDLQVEDLVVGSEVSVSGERDSDGVWRATNIFVPGNHVWAWMLGEITRIDDSDLTVQGHTVRTSSETFFLGEDFQPIAQSDINVGQRVAVSGRWFAGGQLDAENVEVRGADFDELEIRGPITAVNGDIIEINGRPYTLTQDTYIADETGAEVAPGELAQGMFIYLVAKPEGDGTLAVAKIFIDNNDRDNNIRVRGVIQDVLAEGLLVQARAVVFTEETMVVGPGYEPIPAELLEAGQIVSIYGSLNASGDIEAHKVEAVKSQLEEIEFRGSIAEVAGDFIVIRGFEFAFDENSEVQDQNGFQLTSNDLEVGMLANVIGAPDESGLFIVRFMHIGAGNQDRHVNVSGRIESINTAERTLLVQGQTIYVEDWVEVVNANFEYIAFADLSEGDNVRVFGGYELERKIHAYRVEERAGAGGEELEFSGRIEFASAEKIVVRGISFYRNGQTFVSGGDGEFLTFEQLGEGQIVRVFGSPQGESDEAYNAQWINVATGNEDRGIRISGRLVNVDGNRRAIVVRDHVIELNEFAEIVGETYEPVRFDALVAGRQVSAWGWLHENGRIEGFRVEIRVPEKLEIQVFGPVTGVSDGALEVQGIKFGVDEDTFIGSPEIGRLNFDNLFPGVLVDISGITLEDGTVEARHIQLVGLDESQSIEFVGTVGNLADQTFEIGSIPFAIDGDAFVLDGNEQPIRFASVQEGFNVEVLSFGETSDRFLVNFMRVFDIVRDERSIVGRVDAITANAFTLNGVMIEVRDETVFLDPLGDEMEFSDLVERMRLQVKAIILPDGTFIAREVQARPRDRRLTGTVSEISETGMVVAGIEVSFDISTAFFDSEEMEIEAGDIAPGQTVKLAMTLGAGGVPVATEVHVLARIEDEVVLNGTVEAVLDDMIVVLGRRFQVIPNTQMLDAEDNPTALSTFSVGDLVRVRALLLAGDNLVALRIRAQDGEASDIRVEGPIVSVNASTLEVMGIFFFLDENSQFFDLDRNDVDVTSLAVGQTVAVIAEGQANGTVVVQRVQVQNVSLTSGEVTGISGDEFTLFGNNYRVDDNTMVLGANNEQLDLSDISGGQFLEVRGVAEAEGSAAGKQVSPSVLVSKIKIIDAEGSGEYELDVTIEEEEEEEENPTPTSVGEDEVPGSFDLFQNYPNPFNPATAIRFSLPVNTTVTLKVFDITGREVRTLVSQPMTAGTHEVRWDGRSGSGAPVASGVYLYRIETEQFMMTRRMVMLK